MLRLSLLLSLFLFSAQSHALLFIEPFAQVEIGGAEQDYTNQGTGEKRTRDYSTTYTGFGARGGVTFNHFYLGARVSRSTGKWDEGTDREHSDTLNTNLFNQNNPLVEREASRVTFGPMVGVKFGSKALFRMWASYLKSSLEHKVKLDGSDVKKLKGTGFTFGVGLAPARYFSLNLEMQGLWYSEENDKKFHYDETSAGDTYRVAAQSEFGFLFSISIPIGLLYPKGGGGGD